jgi:hypothetical protein
LRQIRICYYCAVVKALYVKEIYLGALHLLLGKSLHRTTSYFLGIAAQLAHHNCHQLAIG